MNLIVCEQCGYEFARVEDKGGKQSLVVHQKMKLLYHANEPKKCEAVCPKCHHHTEVDIELLRRF